MYRKVGRQTKNGLSNDWPKNIEIKSSNVAKTMKDTALRWKWNIMLSICERQKTTVRYTFSIVDLERSEQTCNFIFLQILKKWKIFNKKKFVLTTASPSQKNLRWLRDTHLLSRRFISIFRRESTSAISLVCLTFRSFVWSIASKCPQKILVLQVCYGTVTIWYRNSHRSIRYKRLECFSLWP